jgi:hypothetical protein
LRRTTSTTTSASVTVCTTCSPQCARRRRWKKPAHPCARTRSSTSSHRGRWSAYSPA